MRDYVTVLFEQKYYVFMFDQISIDSSNYMFFSVSFLCVCVHSPFPANFFTVTYTVRLSAAGLLSQNQDDPARWANIPKGVLLTGPPGTGKTLLAKSCAG